MYCGVSGRRGDRWPLFKSSAEVDVGTWGVGPFENDAASDWLFDLEDDGWSAVRVAFEALAADPDADSEEIAVAAAAAVAYAIAPATDDDVDVRALVESISPTFLDAELARRSSTVLMSIRQDSALSSLWSEAGDLADWFAVVDDLIVRLGPSGPPSAPC